jgi:peptide/nickel transport system substrate-binding protein
MHRRDLLIAGAIGMAIGQPYRARSEATPRDTIRVLAEGGANSCDPHGIGLAAASLGIITNVFDRLINFDRVAVGPGVFKYDSTRFIGELADRFEVLDAGRSLLFHLRPDAIFHDGTPVTAADVAWSLARGLALPASRPQFATGSLTDPAQFVVIDPVTLRIDLPRPDRYTLPNLALPFASVLNATLARAHATAADPWATEWLRNNAAGGGAWRIDSWQAGQRVVLSRFDGWRSAPPPQLHRAVFEVVPTAENRVAALEKGDADIVLQLPPKDIAAISANPRVKLVSVPVSNTFRFIAFNTRAAPFSDVRVRRAIAYALPFDDLFQAAMFGHGTRLFGAASAEPASAAFPQPYPYDTDVARARALLAEAGLARGFASTFSYSVADATIAEPIALLLQQALAALGIQIEIERIAAAEWGSRLTAKQVPFFVDTSAAWFDTPDYFFRIFFQGDWRWNFGSFDSPELSALVESARWQTDPAHYDAAIRQAVGIAFRELPILPLWQPSFQAGLNPALTDFTYCIHGQVDCRPLRWT